jgi:hypothetical protein
LLQKNSQLDGFALAGGKILPGRGNTVSTSAVISDHTQLLQSVATTPLPYTWRINNKEERRLTHDNNVYLQYLISKNQSFYCFSQRKITRFS